MKLKHLESALSSCQREFPSPKVELEQYPTSAHLAAWVGLTALEHEDVGEGFSCVDLGSGTGMLAMSCALLGCEYVIAVDCDEEALQVAKENAENLDLEECIDLVLAEVKPPPKQQPEPKSNNSSGRGKGGRGRGRGRGKVKYNKKNSAIPNLAPSNGPDDDGLPLRSNCVDTVVCNPPFGTKHNAGMDVQFLRTAIRLARKAVYSFHKTSTRDYLVKTLGEDWKLDVKVVAQMKFDIPNMYKFHQKKSVDVEVDLIRVGLPCEGDDGSAKEENGDEHGVDATNALSDNSDESDEEG